MKEKKWILMDIEFIRTSPTHRWIRKIYILAKNGIDEMEQEFYPCKHYKDLESKYQRSFQFCRRNIHNLSFQPWRFSAECCQVVAKLSDFIANNDIDVILYKGGTIERELCDELDIPSINIECFKDLEKVHSHEPRVEVNGYYNQLIEFISL